MRHSEQALIVACIVALIAIAVALSFAPTAKERNEARGDIIKAPVLSGWTVIADDVPYNQIIRIHDDEKNVTCWIVSRNGTAMHCIPDNELLR